MSSELAFVDGRCSDKSHADDGAYRMVGKCSNCTADVLGLFTSGHETSNFGPCPRCRVRYRLLWLRLATPDEIPAEATS